PSYPRASHRLDEPPHPAHGADDPVHQTDPSIAHYRAPSSSGRRPEPSTSDAGPRWLRRPRRSPGPPCRQDLGTGKCRNRQSYYRRADPRDARPALAPTAHAHGTTARPEPEDHPTRPPPPCCQVEHPHPESETSGAWISRP